MKSLGEMAMFTVFRRMVIVPAVILANYYTMTSVQQNYRWGLIDNTKGQLQAQEDYNRQTFNLEMQVSAQDWQRFNTVGIPSRVLVSVAMLGLGLFNTLSEVIDRALPQHKKLSSATSVVLLCGLLTMNAIAYVGLAEWSTERVQNFVESLWYNFGYAFHCSHEWQPNCDLVNPMLVANSTSNIDLVSYEAYGDWSSTPPAVPVILGLLMGLLTCLCVSPPECDRPKPDSTSERNAEGSRRDALLTTSDREKQRLLEAGATPAV
jgi:hypothetical protein